LLTEGLRILEPRLGSDERLLTIDKHRFSPESLLKLLGKAE
jgi:hypothetical protein